jgi:lipopolysaccharide transport system ATP-binding protein
MSSSAISVKNVGISYRKRLALADKEKYIALSDVSFEIEHGETLGIVGRNGAGKSTLLRIIADIIKPDTGKVINHGVTVSMLSLNLGLDPQLNGIDNAILSALLLGFKRKEAENNLEQIIKFSELGDFIHQPIKTYSSGMLTRLGFAIAIHLQPDVLLIDEVLGVGDIEFRAKSSEALKSKITSNQTVVLVSHQAAEMKALCDRVIWIEDCSIKRIGTAKNVIDEYESFLLS